MKKVVIIIAIVFSSLALIATFLFFFYISKVELVLKGDKEVYSSIYEEYVDSGVVLKQASKTISNKNYNLEVKSNVDTNNIGSYDVIYKAKFLSKTYTAKRKVFIVDNIAPDIIVNVDVVTRDYCTKKDKTELIYSASDNYDGDMTSNITKEELDDKVILTVTDSSGNISTKQIEIEYSKKPGNTFSLNGKSTVYVPLNGTYKESGATYKDGCGNKINKEISINGDVNTNEVGEYIITYSMDDGSTLKRKVIVHENHKIIYLTFDDGPSYYTKSILNTLAKYNVKATFFVTHQFSPYVYLIADEYNAGHKVAVHTYTHNYNVYSSVDAYINDFNAMNEVIKNYTGSYSNLFRFPGGSSNTISRKYSPGVVSKIASEMTNRGYIYFDWNVSSGDASGANSSKIYSNVVNGVEKCSSCVVLLHDIKSSTTNALDDILSTLTSKGYTFLPLDEASPTAHQTIAN